jgi:acetylornithine deacetylase/succinyl-diaminopimelate desuccinylase-like protein
MPGIKCILIATLSLSAIAQADDRNSPHAQKTLEIYETIIGMKAVKGLGNVSTMASYLEGELIESGFPADDVEILPIGERTAFIARYRGNGTSGRKPILILAHMDVVAALDEDWERPPFKLTSDDEYFYARGAQDNLFGVAQVTSTFIKLQKEGFVPNRDVSAGFTGDEETDMTTARRLATERPDLTEAEFALNSDGVSGTLGPSNEPVSYTVSTAEKTYATWEITARDPGGHSSRPRLDNAIYDLADAIKAIQGYRFPVRWNDTTIESLENMGLKRDDELGEVLVRFARNPEDAEAADRLFREPTIVGQTRTTCVVTMLRGGHAENALPQSATATVNCRIFPGVSDDEVLDQLKKVIGNDALEFSPTYPIEASDPSVLTEDVRAAISIAVQARYPDLRIVPGMMTGATDGVHFRRAGVPTFGASGIFMQPKDRFAHGLNERVPIDTFYGALDHWSIIIRELAGD